MRTLIYKRTHSGDPNPETRVFGNKDCMGTVRGRQFDAVIGVGGIGAEPKRHGIAYKLTWIGMGPHKTGDPLRPQVTFDHFRYYGKWGPRFDKLAPKLASRMYNNNVRQVMDDLSPEEQLEVEKILRRAKDSPPSMQRAGLAGRDFQNTKGKCR
jgi:hypothetical protein